MTWGAIGWGFLMGMFKFLFASSFLDFNYPDLSVFEVFCITASGALFCFNLTYWSAEYLMHRAKKKRIEAIKNGKSRKRKSFTKMNKLIVKIKMSRFGFMILGTIGIIIMSIPISGIVMAKFYGDSKKSFILPIITIIVSAILLAMFSSEVSDYLRS